jgi:ribosome-binding factor A
MGKQRRSRERRDDRDGIARAARLENLICEEVNLLLRDEIRDRRLDNVSITMVELAEDGSRARLWYSADEDRGDALDGAVGFVRVRLAESLGLKRTPEIRFRRDPATRTFGEALAMEED